MKRLPELRDLSEDHHHGLVLARRALRASNSAERSVLDDVWADVLRHFETTLEPHFHIEESLIAPILEKQGESQLAARLYEEHSALRQLVGTMDGEMADNLRRFGELLEKHIRFEERELFEVAQRVLSADALRAVADACRALRS